MDADDVCAPTRLARQLALMRFDQKLVGCGSHVEYFPRDAVKDGALRYQDWMNEATLPEEIERELFVECPLAHPTFFLNAEAVDAVGGYRDAGWAEDYDMILRLWEAGGRFAKVPAVLVRWREGPHRLSRTDPRYAPEAFLACKVHYLRKTLLDGRDGIVVWGAGPVGKAAAKAFVEAGTELIAFVEVDPRKIGQEIHGVPVLGLEEGAGVGGALHLAAVGQPGARERIREALRAAGRTELRDFAAIA
jgi:hypothetical protein